MGFESHDWLDPRRSKRESIRCDLIGMDHSVSLQDWIESTDLLQIMGLGAEF